ncbi:hypothetical protein I6N91_13450 [Arthrobacter sp. MSA 4-2]|uniref:hypothetical protein n=1 Tax=Arthrobacter sp. MSA 4-2 TaxID=2794349 RepID=UPI0018E8B561|nr:hypothetical protein [Arthrobacter sp. MSA 4-2]MBJ2121986.1 hypothetical protein [Arthrobacter sp. MSA 4-2]
MAQTTPPGGRIGRDAGFARPALDGSPGGHARRRAMENHPSSIGARKLRILVRLDPELASARICVRGVLTPANLYALYCIARRTNGLQPGMPITVDLTGAQAQADALEALHLSAAERRLPATVDPTGSPCWLTVLEPGPGTGSPR